MKKLLLLILVSTISFGFSATRAMAQKSHAQGWKSAIDSLSPEQKKAFRKNMKARMDSLSPEQKKQFRKKMRQKYNSLTPEQKQKFREQMINRTDSTGNGRRFQRKKLQPAGGQ